MKFESGVFAIFGLLCLLAALFKKQFYFSNPGHGSRDDRPMPLWFARPFFVGLGAFTLWLSYHFWTQ